METANRLTTPECWDAIADRSVGRLALSIRALPVILPVQYYLDGGDIAICLGHHPLNVIDPIVVAFAVDAIDTASWNGWTVQIQGSLTPLGAMGRPADCGQPAAGQVVHLAPLEISGYRLQLCPFLSL